MLLGGKYMDIQPGSIFRYQISTGKIDVISGFIQKGDERALVNEDVEVYQWDDGQDIIWHGLDVFNFERVCHATKERLNIVYGEVVTVENLPDWMFLQLFAGRFGNGLKYKLEEMFICPDGGVVFRDGGFRLSMCCHPLKEDPSKIHLLAKMIASAYCVELPEITKQAKIMNRMMTCWDFTAEGDDKKQEVQEETS